MTTSALKVGALCTIRWPAQAQVAAPAEAGLGPLEQRRDVQRLEPGFGVQPAPAHGPGVGRGPGDAAPAQRRAQQLGAAGVGLGAQRAVGPQQLRCRTRPGSARAGRPRRRRAAPASAPCRASRSGPDALAPSAPPSQLQLGQRALGERCRRVRPASPPPTAAAAPSTRRAAPGCAPTACPSAAASAISADGCAIAQLGQFDLRVQRRVALRAQRPARLGTLQRPARRAAARWRRACPGCSARGQRPSTLASALSLPASRASLPRAEQQLPQRLQLLQRRHARPSGPSGRRGLRPGCPDGHRRAGGCRRRRAAAGRLVLPLAAVCSARLPLSGTPARRLGSRPSCARPRSRDSVCTAEPAPAGSCRSKSAAALSRCGPWRHGESSRPGHQGSGSNSRSVAWPLAAQPADGVARDSRALSVARALAALRQQLAQLDAQQVQARIQPHLHRLRRPLAEQVAVEVAAQRRPARCAACCRRSRCRRAAAGRPAACRARARPAASAAAPTTGCRHARRPGSTGRCRVTRPAPARALPSSASKVFTSSWLGSSGRALSCSVSVRNGQAAFVPAAGVAVVQRQLQGCRQVQPLRACRRVQVERGARCVAVQRRQVERASAGLQVAQRPGGEGPQRGAGVQRLRRARRRGLRAQRGLQLRRGQRAGQAQRGRPFAGAGGLLGQVERCVHGQAVGRWPPGRGRPGAACPSRAAGRPACARRRRRRPAPGGRAAGAAACRCPRRGTRRCAASPPSRRPAVPGSSAARCRCWARRTGPGRPATRAARRTRRAATGCRRAGRRRGALQPRSCRRRLAPSPGSGSSTRCAAKSPSRLPRMPLICSPGTCGSSHCAPASVYSSHQHAPTTSAAALARPSR